jgi:hypothetical protein
MLITLVGFAAVANWTQALSRNHECDKLLRIIRDQVSMRIFRPLRGRSMALLWGELSFSAIGDQRYAVAMTWIAVGALGSNAEYLCALRLPRGNVQTGCGFLLLAFANVLPTEWRVAGFAVASAFAAMGGPMQNIPIAVPRQTTLAPADRVAAMRAYVAILRIGVLVAMLLTPVAISLVGVCHVILGSAAVYSGVAATGVTRLAGWRDETAATSSSPIRRSAC